MYEWTKDRRSRACINKHGPHSMSQKLLTVPFEHKYNYLPLSLQAYNRMRSLEELK